MLNRNKKQHGFTLIELLIVMAIIGMLAAIVGPRIFGGFEKASCNAAASQLSSLGAALDQHRLDTGKYPTSMEGLLKNTTNSPRWNGPYLRKGTIPKDPWDKEYQYKFPGAHGDYDLFSLGADGVEGGDGCPNGDITNWK
jgi:general secretion pathway protein G